MNPLLPPSFCPRYEMEEVNNEVPCSLVDQLCVQNMLKMKYSKMNFNLSIYNKTTGYSNLFLIFFSIVKNYHYFNICFPLPLYNALVHYHFKFCVYSNIII